MKTQLNEICIYKLNINEKIQIKARFNWLELIYINTIIFIKIIIN